MGPLRELLAVDERRTLEFFVTGLQDVCDGGVDRQELLYNASVLAHYALVSTQSTSDMPAPASLTAVFDQFVLDTTMLEDPQLLETAAAQCLLLAGFFEDQSRRRHNIRGTRDLGASFFSRAAAQRALGAQGRSARDAVAPFRALAPPPRAPRPRAARSALPVAETAVVGAAFRRPQSGRLDSRPPT